MFSRALVISAVAAMALGTSVVGAQATPGPPPPVSTNGHPVELFASGVMTPTSFAFGAGQVFEGDGGSTEGNGPPNGGVFLLKNGGATELPGSPQFVAGLAWHDRALYVSGGSITQTGVVWTLQKWSGWTGKTFKSQKAIYTAPAGFDGFNGIAFSANGRLFVGVDVGLTDGNDHGPASTPFVYDILSLNADGSDVKVYAKGMRQPWQLAFPRNSNVPFATDLGQDSGAKNPPDFLLRVRQGQNYGFPTCNQTSAKPCAGFAQPLRQFAPHTDLMGIGIRGVNLYLTSFAGHPGGAGEVFTLSRKGGPLKPLITGFVAPTVGLGVHGGYVYVGELTGQVFRLKI